MHGARTAAIAFFWAGFLVACQADVTETGPDTCSSTTPSACSLCGAGAISSACLCSGDYHDSGYCCTGTWQAADCETISVAISPKTASVATSGTTQFSATVTGTSDTSVTFSVVEGAAG